MRKKGSRVVVVDGQRYRWRIRRAPTYSQAAYATTLIFSVQREDGGSVLTYGADGPRPDNWLGHPGAVVTPAVVVNAIRSALQAGWQAGVPGPTFKRARKPRTKPSPEPVRLSLAPPQFSVDPTTAAEAGHAPYAPLNEATIRFEGEAFHSVTWSGCLAALGFRIYGGCQERAVWVSGGNNVRAEAQGFVSQSGRPGYEWRVVVQETERWGGAVKLGAVLLAAFTLPQQVSVAIAKQVFKDRQGLRASLEAAILRDFGLDELTDHGAWRESDGVQFI